ncbi:MAG: hypothetical protein ACRDJ2_08080 [Actinomycetota bacterium]
MSHSIASNKGGFGQGDSIIDWSFGDVIWAMFIFFGGVLFIWMFVAVFTDNLPAARHFRMG